MDNQIQNKLSQFEVEPPAAIWQRLEDALDEKTLEVVGGRLSQFEVAPEESNWNNIIAQINEATPAKVIPFYRRYAKQLKYGSAVAVFATVALIANLLISKKTESEPSVQDTVKRILNSNRESQQFDAVIEPRVSNDKVVSGDKVNVESENSAPGTDNRSVAYNSIKRKGYALSPVLGAPTAASVTVIPGCAEQNTAIAFSKDADRYMAYSLDNGNAVKLPKKMYDAITCPTKDVNCLQKIKQLQEKMAASTMLTDFNGVLDMLDNLGENQ